MAANRTVADRLLSIGEGVFGNAIFWAVLQLAGVKLSPVGWILAASIVAFVLLIVLDLLRARRPAREATSPAETTFDWSNPTAVLTAQLEHPVFRGGTRSLETSIVLITFRELPRGTRVIRWSAGLTMNGVPVGKPEEDGADKELVRSGKTDLGRVGVTGFPVAPFGASGVEWRNIEVGAKFTAELREPGRVDPIILNVDTVSQILMVN